MTGLRQEEMMVTKDLRGILECGLRGSAGRLERIVAPNPPRAYHQFTAAQIPLHGFLVLHSPT